MISDEELHYFQNIENYEDLITELNKNFEKYETNYDALKIDNNVGMLTCPV